MGLGATWVAISALVEPTAALLTFAGLANGLGFGLGPGDGTGVGAYLGGNIGAGISGGLATGLGPGDGYTLGHNLGFAIGKGVGDGLVKALHPLLSKLGIDLTAELGGNTGVTSKPEGLVRGATLEQQIPTGNLYQRV